MAGGAGYSDRSESEFGGEEFTQVPDDSEESKENAGADC